MVKDILLEIGVEEIPSAYMPKAIADLIDIAEQKLNKARLNNNKQNKFDLSYLEMAQVLHSWSKNLTKSRRMHWLRPAGTRKVQPLMGKGIPVKQASVLPEVRAWILKS